MVHNGTERISCRTRDDAGVSLHWQELEQERGAKRKLESLVSSLMQEVERLKEVRRTFHKVTEVLNECM